MVCLFGDASITCRVIDASMISQLKALENEHIADLLVGLTTA